MKLTHFSVAGMRRSGLKRHCCTLSGVIEVIQPELLHHLALVAQWVRRAASIERAAGSSLLIVDEICQQMQKHRAHRPVRFFL